MEVHHHAHPSHGKKTWREYFWEFLMLFLAVFCGFLAEYQLEHKIERDRERQFIKSLFEDLSEDTSSLKKIVQAQNENIAMMDSLKNILCIGEINNHGADTYYWGRMVTRGKFLSIHDRTIQQMKNSGGFRLIRNQIVSKAIIDYYNRLTFIEAIQATEMGETLEYRKMAIEIFHPGTFSKMIDTNNDIIRPTGNPALLTYDKSTLLHIAGMIVYIANARKALAVAENDMNTSAKALIDLLNKEYHLN
jgi:hypothetical protein